MAFKTPSAQHDDKILHSLKVKLFRVNEFIKKVVYLEIGPSLFAQNKKGCVQSCSGLSTEAHGAWRNPADT